MTKIGNFFRSIFVEPPCQGCIARDNHIASLEQQLYQKDSLIMKLEDAIAKQDEIKNDIVKHLTGMNRVASAQPSTLHSIPRGNGIQDRIKRAEAKESDPVLAEQRKKEYEARIETLVNPKPEVVVKDAI